MKKLLAFAVVCALLVLSAGLPLAGAEETEAENEWSAGMVTAMVEGKSITVAVAGEEEGVEDSVTFAVSEETEFYGEIKVGMTVEVEHQGDRALFIQPGEEG